MNDLFVIADTHLDHPHILEYCPRGVSTIEEMNEMLVTNWNSRVSTRDTVIIVGDLAFKNHRKWLGRLRGRKILVKGNHDDMSQEIYSQCFITVKDIYIRSFEKTSAVFCHYAMRAWPFKAAGAIHLYGHSHGRLPEIMTERACDCGCDIWNYFPQPIDVFFNKLNARPVPELGRGPADNSNVFLLRNVNKEFWIK